MRQKNPQDLLNSPSLLILLLPPHPPSNAHTKTLSPLIWRMLPPPSKLATLPLHLLIDGGASCIVHTGAQHQREGERQEKKDKSKWCNKKKTRAQIKDLAPPFYLCCYGICLLEKEKETQPYTCVDNSKHKGGRKRREATPRIQREKKNS